MDLVLRLGFNWENATSQFVLIKNILLPLKRSNIFELITHLLPPVRKALKMASLNFTEPYVNATRYSTLLKNLMSIVPLAKVVYAIGILGNAIAIIALRFGERRVRNRKHLLLLTSLAANDLVALVSILHCNVCQMFCF